MPTTASGRPAPLTGRTSSPPPRANDSVLERHVGAMRSRIELLANRVEKLETASGGASDRVTRDVDSLKRDMVRVAALAERGGAVKDHLNRLSRQVDELAGGAKVHDDVTKIDARVSRLARESEDVRDRLADRIERLEATLGGVVTALAALTERVEALAAAPPAAAEPRAAAAPAGKSGADDLRQIKGIGPKFEKALRAAGVDTWAQIAAWTDDDVDAMAEKLGIKATRIRKAGWVAKAKALLDG